MRRARRKQSRSIRLLFLGLALLVGQLLSGSVARSARAFAEPVDVFDFDAFRPPSAWQNKFWADKSVNALLDLDLAKIAALVPDQGGVRYCRCPNCGADESDEPLSWSIADPAHLVCKRCRSVFPNEKIPAREKGKDAVPEETVEVLPGIIHRYPYHELEPLRQHYPNERVYLAAHRDEHAKMFAAKLALYAAARLSDQPASNRDPRFAKIAAVLLTRFAETYPTYATRLDRPGRPKLFDRADLPPPYRLGWETGKWAALGGSNVPLNLVVAYALIRREESAWEEAGRLLKTEDPRERVERSLFLASAEFVRNQPQEVGEQGLEAVRGMLAVGRLLRNRGLIDAARLRFDHNMKQGFYYDGLWRDPSERSRRRVSTLLDHWIARLLPEEAREKSVASPAIVRAAGSIWPPGSNFDDGRNLFQAVWPPSSLARSDRSRAPILFGGGGIARLSLGSDADRLDAELLGSGDRAGAASRRLVNRIAVGGKPVLDDLDDAPRSFQGWERASASHNTVLVDGLNHRERIVESRRTAPGSDFLFFAADPDLQIAWVEDRFAYPESLTRFREMLLLSAVGRRTYAVSIVEVRGGAQHDQIFHAAPGTSATWKTDAPTVAGPESLLPSSIRFLPQARAEDGRWFTQALGEFQDLREATVNGPTIVRLESSDRPSLRLRFLNDFPSRLYLGQTPRDRSDSPADEPKRAGLVLRRRSTDGSALNSIFVTVIEPDRVGRDALKRVVRLASPPESIVLLAETNEGSELLGVNLKPGVRRGFAAADGTSLATDGLAFRLSAKGAVLVGGTFLDVAGKRIASREAAFGRVHGVLRLPSASDRGFFEVDRTFRRPAELSGRTMFIKHGDGATHSWTIDRIENVRNGKSRVFVKEEPGFLIENQTGDAVYERFPGDRHPGPHRFRVAALARSAGS